MPKNKKTGMFEKITREMIKEDAKNIFSLDKDKPNEVLGWIKTPCYMLNALMSDADMDHGIPRGKRLMVAGSPSTAKSLLLGFLIKSYLDARPDDIVYFMESEGANVMSTCKTMDIPLNRVKMIRIKTVEDLIEKTEFILNKIVSGNEDLDEEDKISALICVDSVGMLSTRHEIDIVQKRTGKKDMTKAQLFHQFGRLSSAMVSDSGSTMILVNHTYATMDQYSPRAIKGGDGMIFMADVILELGKSAEKDESAKKKKIGVAIQTTVRKSRMMIEGTKSKISILFKSGVLRYSGLFLFAKEYGVIKKDGMSYILPNGQKVVGKTLRTNFREYFTKSLYEAIRDEFKKQFIFGKAIGEEYDSEFVDEPDSATEEKVKVKTKAPSKKKSPKKTFESLKQKRRAPNNVEGTKEDDIE